MCIRDRADAGYLTRRLVDVSHDVIINEEDCGTLRGLVCTALKNNDETIATLYERILGRVSVHDIVHPTNGELLVAGGEEITEAIAQKIEDSPIEDSEAIISAMARPASTSPPEVLSSTKRPSTVSSSSIWAS